MITLTIDTTTTLGLSFEHSMAEGKWDAKTQDWLPRDKMTKALLFKDPKVEKQTPIAVGIAVCSHKDQFKKETGRKVSLTRALKILYPTDKDKREAAWLAYFKRGTRTKEV